MWIGLRGLWEQITVLIDDLARPLHLVLDALSLGVRRGPQFEVLQPVVISHSVGVVNRLLGKKFSTQVALHGEAVDQHGPASGDVLSDVPIIGGVGSASLGAGASGANCPHLGLVPIEASKLLVMALTVPPRNGHSVAPAVLAGVPVLHHVVVVAAPPPRKDGRIAMIDRADPLSARCNERFSLSGVPILEPAPVVHVAHRPSTDLPATSLDVADLVRVDGV